MDFKKMQYYITVAEERNFTRAAESLHVAQSSLSEQIQKVEEELGCQLIVRSYKNISLTRAGEIFYGYCVQALKDYADMKDSIGRAQENIKIGLFYHVHIDEWINKIKQYSQNSQIQYSLYYMSDMVTRLLNNEIQVGLCIRNSKLDMNGFKFHQLLQSKVGIYSHSQEEPKFIYILSSVSMIDPSLIDKVLAEAGYSGLERIYKNSLEEISFGLMQKDTCALIIDTFADTYHLDCIYQSAYTLDIGWYYKGANPSIRWVIDNLT